MRTNTIIVNYINKTSDIFREAYICDHIYSYKELKPLYPEFLTIVHVCNAFNPLTGEHKDYSKRTMINKRQIKRIDIVED